MKVRAILAVLFGVLYMVSGGAFGQASTQGSYGPFTGDSGYQDVKLSEQSWYVAYHGNRQTSLDQVQLGWQARVAELCGSLRATLFVELRYVGEPLLPGDPAVAGDPAQEGWIQLAKGSYVYIPIFTPRPNYSAMSLMAPSKLAAVRCLWDATGLIDPSRAASIPKVREDARRAGIGLKE